MSDDSIRNVIPLLSPKHLNSFTPEEYRTYVRSLLNRPPRKLPRVKKEVEWRLTSKGKFSLQIKRRPKWISREEIEALIKESKFPANEVWLYVLSAKSKIRISTREEEERIKKEVSEIPWPSTEEKK